MYSLVKPLSRSTLRRRTYVRACKDGRGGRNAILCFLRATQECLVATERSVGIAVEVGRVLREESEEVVRVLALLDVNIEMSGHLRLLSVRGQNQPMKRKGHPIEKTTK